MKSGNRTQKNCWAIFLTDTGISIFPTLYPFQLLANIYGWFWENKSQRIVITWGAMKALGNLKGSLGYLDNSGCRGEGRWLKGLVVLKIESCYTRSFFEILTWFKFPEVFVTAKICLISHYCWNSLYFRNQTRRQSFLKSLIPQKKIANQPSSIFPFPREQSMLIWFLNAMGTIRMLMKSTLPSPALGTVLGAQKWEAGRGWRGMAYWNLSPTLFSLFEIFHSCCCFYCVCVCACLD